MDMFFIDEGGKGDLIKLPILPSEIKIDSPQKTEKFTTMNNGEINIKGKKQLKSLSIDSFFPSQEYAFVRSYKWPDWNYVDMFELWRDQVKPIRLMINRSPLYTVFNELVVIPSFEYGPQDGTNDVYYSMDIEESPMPKLRRKGHLYD